MTRVPAIPIGSPTVNVSTEIDIGAMLRVLWRRKIVFVSAVAAITSGTFLLLNQLTPKYTATALVMIETQAPKVLTIESLIPSLTTDTSSMETQSQIIQSTALLREVVDRLALTGDPEFNLALRPGRRLIDLLGNIGLNLGEHATNDLRVLENVVSRISVAPRGKSSVIAISFVAESPEKAAKIANTIAEVYLADKIKQKDEANNKARAWLAGRVDEVHQRLVQIEEAIVKFQRENDLQRGQWQGGTASTITEQQLTELNTQLTVARTEASKAGSRMGGSIGTGAKSDLTDSMAEVVNSPLIQSLRQQEAQLVQRAAELSSAYGAQYPGTLKVAEELQQLRNKIRLEADKISAAVRADAERARRQVAALQQALNTLRAQADLGKAAAVRLLELEREADATRSLYNKLLSRSEEIAAQGALQTSDIRVIANALPPNTPTYPQKLLITGGAAFGSVLLVAVALLIIENRRVILRSKQEIEQLAGIPALGLIPLSSRSGWFRQVSAPPVLGRPDPIVCQAVRSLYTTLLLSSYTTSDDEVDRARRAKVILVTSSIPGEGKSVTSVSLAVQATRSRKRCLLVDCDFRRSRITRYLEVEEGIGLAQVLLGEAPISDAVHQRETDGLHFITSGAATYTRSDPERLRTMKDLVDMLNWRLVSLLRELVSQYDVIILDSPPIMVVPDALVLSLVADQTVYVIRWLRTKADLVLDGTRRLREVSATPIGFVLTQVDMKRYVKYAPNSPLITSRLYQEYY